MAEYLKIFVTSKTEVINAKGRNVRVCTLTCTHTHSQTLTLTHTYIHTYKDTQGVYILTGSSPIPMKLK